MSQITSNIRTDPKSALGLTYAANRRFLWNYMLSIQSSVTAEEHTLDVSLDRAYNNMTFKFTPLLLHNDSIAVPRIGIEKPFSDYQFVASTDLYSLNL